MPHFFIKSANVNENLALIDDEDNYRHIAKSLRAKTGEKIFLIDENQIRYKGNIIKIDKTTITVSIKEHQKSERELEFELYLAQTPLRSDSQNMIAEKATELGVKKIYPLMSDNCALSLDTVEKKIPKWQKIMYEASKQCERAKIPECMPAINFKELPKVDRTIVFCEKHTDLPMKKYLKDNPIKTGEKILIIIGPEGGFSEKEFDFFKNSGMIMLTLGDLILKAETAVIVSIGNLVYEFENNRKD